MARSSAPFALAKALCSGPPIKAKAWPDSTALVWPEPVSMVTIFTTMSDSAKSLLAMAMYIRREPVLCTGSATRSSLVAARATIAGAARASETVAVDCRNFRLFMIFLTLVSGLRITFGVIPGNDVPLLPHAFAQQALEPGY